MGNSCGNEALQVQWNRKSLFFFSLLNCLKFFQYICEISSVIYFFVWDLLYMRFQHVDVMGWWEL